MYGQDLKIEETKEGILHWRSFDHQNQCWLEVCVSTPKLELITTGTTHSKEQIKLLQLLKTIKKQNPVFLSESKGLSVKTHLTFPRNWGLGSSSTLLSNLAQWAEVNPYQLLKETFGGSGYDLSCATNNKSILYSNKYAEPTIEQVNFQPPFIDQLYFVHLNQKENSQKEVQRYLSLKKTAIKKLIQTIDQLTDAFVSCNNLIDFEKLMQEHEILVSKTIQKDRIKQLAFSDYFGQTKSLGAWGGDFILATGNEDTPTYFKQKGFSTVIPYQKMVLHQS